jgi:hypothetical protein
VIARESSDDRQHGQRALERVHGAGHEQVHRMPRLGGGGGARRDDDDGDKRGGLRRLPRFRLRLRRGRGSCPTGARLETVRFDDS